MEELRLLLTILGSLCVLGLFCLALYLLDRVVNGDNDRT